jgi:hypothetical protein
VNRAPTAREAMEQLEQSDFDSVVLELERPLFEQQDVRVRFAACRHPNNLPLRAEELGY